MTAKKFACLIVILMLTASCAWGATYNINSDADFRNYMLDDTLTRSTSNTFVLNTDIQLADSSNWPGIGTAASPFRGHFNGNGHTVYVNIKPLPPTGASYLSITENRALFVYVGNGAVIENLSVEGSVSGYNAGGIASIVDGGTITNCSFSGDVAAVTRKGQAVVNEVINELADAQIADVNDIERFDSVISSDPSYKGLHRNRINAGGLVGVMESGTISGCSFRGKVSANSDATYSVAGGIAGRFYGGSISSCDVVGDSAVEASTATTTSNAFAEAGGIVGYSVTPLDSTIEHCTFEGSVDSTSYAGGIAGYVRGTELYGNSVRANSDVAGRYSAGGIAGYLASGGTATSNNVEAGAIVIADSYSAGGIVGCLDTEGQAVSDNDSDAAIRGNAQYLGGIVGALSNSTNATSAVGTGNTYSGADAGIGRDEYNRSTDGNTTPKQDVTYSIITAGLAEATVGVKYEAKLETNAAQTRTVTYAYSGTLPGGLNFSPDGVIAGTPTEAGTFTFSARGNIQNIGYTASKDFTLTLSRKFEITPDIDSELSATEGVFFTQSFSATHGAVLTAKGSLPAGVTVTHQTSQSSILAAISGYPQKSGTYTFSIEGTSGDAFHPASTGTITLVVKPAIEFATLSLNPASATQGEYYSAGLDVYINVPKDTLSTNSLVWSIASGTLPEGLAISGDLNGGRITGSPSRAGEFSFTVKAELSFSAGATTITSQATQDFTLTVEAPTIGEAHKVNGTLIGTKAFTTIVEGGSAPTTGTTSSNVTSSDTEVELTPVTLPSGKEGSYYECILSNDSFSISSGTLPDGLSLGNNGMLSGTPTKSGRYTFIIENYSYTIRIDTALVILSDYYLPSATIREWYSYTISTDAKQPLAVRWTQLSGDLPGGLEFNPLTGNISGIPQKIGESIFTLQAALGNYLAVKNFSLVVGPSLVISDDAVLPDGKVGVEYSYAFTTDSEYYVHWTLEDGSFPEGLSLSGDVLFGIPNEEGKFTFTLLAESGGLTSSKEFTLNIAPALSITTPSVLPAAHTKKAYSFTLETDAPEGSSVLWSVEAYQDVLSSDTVFTHYYSRLPEGMYIEEDTGTIYGTPDTTGVYYFMVMAVMGEISTSKNFTLNVRPTLDIMTESPLPHAEVNEPYSVTLSSDANASHDVTWTLTGGDLPGGLTLDSKTGTISGYPLSEGKYTFTIEVFSNGLRTSKEFELTAGQPMSIITDAIMPVLDAGSDFSLELETDRGGNNSQWSLDAGRLPPGLTLNTSTGIISGKPVRAGAYTFIVKNVSGYSEAVKEFTINVGFVITSNAHVDTGTSGKDYSYRFTAEGVPAGAILWSASQDIFPTGITLSPNGHLYGKTNESGTYSFTVSAFVSNDVYAQKFVTLTISSYSALPIVTAQLPDGQVGKEYYAEVRSSVEGVTWEVSGLPAGLGLTSSFGEGVCAIYGVPSEAGTFHVLVSGHTSTRHASKQFDLKIAAAPVVAQESSGGGGGCDSGFGALGLLFFAQLTGLLRKR